jgi:hypothetical protein
MSHTERHPECLPVIYIGIVFAVLVLTGARYNNFYLKTMGEINYMKKLLTGKLTVFDNSLWSGNPGR